MGYDPLSPMLYTYNKDQDGNIESVQSMTLLGNGRTSSLFKKNVPGMWFTQQSEEVMETLLKMYEDEPYPTEENMAEIATRVNAPSVTQIKTFFNNMHQKEQTGYL
uniref:Homeobox domain-containing protein n=1 Tax=Pyramimonas obovata TaxID=1411642 RepID=A0A7S0N1H9_9CHLO|mmetsp:Transcript_18443/g.40324  ORF Transcript_18443/g.40324 Transcript_18443/m.40324 type:complete len:106 (+) Transcript_18443:187-504(+)|eukprot:CAMPEP_0118958714 /NCGR_PEP_ID=MMETSP1169-20130426/62765_1 /TAXON_ID=36882 /ORGANISM="Pyramimonas obovata, Strain CCMP722" /LENGTH=105 /DNA_ID=CAMNT_0006906839 /DNA_START=115 /DNA_END=432 /DNA_ORIENTATION=-